MAPPKIFVVAAEASGDRLGADLIKALRAQRPDAAFAGVGGRQMQDEGIRSPFDISELSVLGLIEGLKAYPKVIKRVADTQNAIDVFDPDVVVLIDSWGFTLRVAQSIRRSGSRARLVKYIGPQVWASRSGRAKTLAQTVDHLLCIYDFETPYYAPYGLPCMVVGNPVANTPVRKGDANAFRNKYGIDPHDPILLLLFGSRPSEIQRIGEDFVETAKQLKEHFPNLRVVTVAADTIRDDVERTLKSSPGALILHDLAEKENAFAAATVALACSGSVTTELALQGAPMVVGYRLSAISWFLIKRILYKGRFATLLNIAADREIVPEFLQKNCTPEKLAPALTEMLKDDTKRLAQIEAQNAALKVMGQGKKPAAETAAGVVLQQLASS